MGRPNRIDNAGSWYHVFNRGAAKQDIFRSDRDRVEFERLLGLIAERFGIRVHAYCLMTNHFHLLIECPDGQLSEAMHLLGSVFVRHVNERAGRDGPLFRGRFSAKPVATDEYLRRLVRYIHRNPLAFTTVDGLRTYRWSSMRVYLGRRRAPRWMTTQNVLSMFDSVEELDRFVTADDNGAHGRIGPEGWADAIDLVIDERLGDGARQRVATTVALVVLDELDGDHGDDLRATLEFPSPTAERMARSRARRRVAEQPELRDVVAGVLDLAA
jgi:putative transposase